MLHCCGKVDEIFPDLIECGLDIFNPFQPEVMDVFEIKRKFGNDLTFYGGVSIQKTLPFESMQRRIQRALGHVDMATGVGFQPLRYAPTM